MTLSSKISLLVERISGEINTLRTELSAVQKRTVLVQGRYTVATTQAWYSDASPQYGVAIYNHMEHAGTGADPVTEFENIAVPVRAGEVLKNVVFFARGNNNDIVDFEYEIRFFCATAGQSYTTGLSADADITLTTIKRDFFMNPSGGPALGLDIIKPHIVTLPLDFVFTQDGMFAMYVRPTGIPASTRYIYSSKMYEIECI